MRQQDENELIFDAEEGWAQWLIMDARSKQKVETPWAELWLGAEQGAGLEVWVQASQAFHLTLFWGETSFFEAITPGRSRLLLTVLDRTEVLRSDD